MMVVGIISMVDVFQELRFTILGNPGKVTIRTGKQSKCRGAMVSSPFNAKGRFPDGLDISDLYPTKEGRVWYAHVILLFQVRVEEDTEKGPKASTKDLAYVTWYERLGSCAKEETRKFNDPDFPAVLGDLFPRIYLVEPDLDPCYAVIPVEDIISPAPIHDDVSVRHVTAVDIANGQALTGAARASHLQRADPLEPALIPDRHQCKQERKNTPCTIPSCTR